MGEACRGLCAASACVTSLVSAAPRTRRTCAEPRQTQDKHEPPSFHKVELELRHRVTPRVRLERHGQRVLCCIEVVLPLEKCTLTDSLH